MYPLQQLRSFSPCDAFKPAQRVCYRAAMLAPILALALYAQNATSQRNGSKGADLYRDCRTYVAVMEKGRPADYNEAFDAGVCIGYVSGLTQGSRSLGLTCPPPGSTIGTLIKEYILYMDSHPRVLDFDRSAGVNGTLKEAYPCPAQ